MSIVRRSPALAFWLDYVHARGGLWEQAGDTVLVMLPARLAVTHDLPESALVTDDADVAREDDVPFLGPGHPEIAKAADAVVEEGDVSVVALAHPKPMSTDDVLARVRDQVPIEHGRIDATTSTIRARRPTLRLGVLVSHTVSAEEQFTEVAECLVDVASCRIWPDGAPARAPTPTPTRPTVPRLRHARVAGRASPAPTAGCAARSARIRPPRANTARRTCGTAAATQGRGAEGHQLRGARRRRGTTQARSARRGRVAPRRPHPALRRRRPAARHRCPRRRHADGVHLWQLRPAR